MSTVAPDILVSSRPTGRFCLRCVTAAMCLIASLARAGGPPAAAVVFHSPTDDGISSGIAAIPMDASMVPLNLWIFHGAEESFPEDKCAGTGTGVEFCNWDVRLSTTGDVTFTDFVTSGDADEGDNCTLVANPDQRDTNGDGFGNICDADLDNSGVVNFGYLALFKAAFLTADPHADFDGSGFVNFGDLAIIKAQFLGPPG